MVYTKQIFPVGESETKVLTLKSVNSRPTSMSLLWTASPATAGYIVQVFDGDRLAFVDSLVDKKYMNVKELTASTTYKIMGWFSIKNILNEHKSVKIFKTCCCCYGKQCLLYYIYVIFMLFHSL